MHFRLWMSFLEQELALLFCAPVVAGGAAEAVVVDGGRHLLGPVLEAFQVQIADELSAAVGPAHLSHGVPWARFNIKISA